MSGSVVYNDASKDADAYLLMLEQNLRRGSYVSDDDDFVGSMTHDEMMLSRLEIHDAIIESARRNHKGENWFGVFDPVSFFAGEGSGDPYWVCTYEKKSDRETFEKENRKGFNIILKTAQLIMEKQYNYKDEKGVVKNPWLERDKAGKKKWLTYIYAVWSDMKEEVANAGSHNQPDMGEKKYFEGSHVAEITFGMPFFKKQLFSYSKKRRHQASSSEAGGQAEEELRYMHNESYEYFDYQGMRGGTKQGKSTHGNVSAKDKRVFGISLTEFETAYYKTQPGIDRRKDKKLLPISTNLLLFIMVTEHEVLHILLGRFLKCFADITEHGVVQPNPDNRGKLHGCQTDEGHNETFIRLASLFYGFDGVHVGISTKVVDPGETYSPQNVDNAWPIVTEISDRARRLMDHYMGKKEEDTKKSSTELLQLKF